MNSVSNRSKDIIALIIKVCRWVLLNNKIFTFHDLYTFTESIDKQQPLFHLIQNNYYICVGGGGFCELLVNFVDFLFIVVVVYSCVRLELPITMHTGLIKRNTQCMYR